MPQPATVKSPQEFTGFGATGAVVGRSKRTYLFGTANPPDMEVLTSDVVLEVLDNCQTSEALGACLRFVRAVIGAGEKELRRSCDRLGLNEWYEGPFAALKSTPEVTEFLFLFIAFEIY
jgi:hypothetical protein